MGQTLTNREASKTNTYIGDGLTSCHQSQLTPRISLTKHRTYLYILAQNHIHTGPNLPDIESLVNGQDYSSLYIRGKSNLNPT